MPAAPPDSPNHPARFVLRALAWGLGIFGLLKSGWFEGNLVLPFTRFQGAVGAGLCGAPSGAVLPTVACSGTDVMALCLAAILAYPASWRARLRGAAGGLALIVVLNVLRIGTLGRAAGAPRLFTALHLYLWPAVLIAGVAAYVFLWTRWADRGESAGAAPLPGHRNPLAAGRGPRFLVLTVAFVAVYLAASPRCLESRLLRDAAVAVAGWAALLLSLAGAGATSSANVLSTSRGAFAVTPDCLYTPLIPVYLAAVLACSRGWRRAVAGLLAAVPLFLVLGVARLLVVALPGQLIGSPLIAVHSFYQVLLAAVLVLLAAARPAGGVAPALGRWLTALAGGLAVALLVGWVAAPAAAWLARALAGAMPGGPGAAGALDDPQGAIALLAPFEAGLFVALWLAVFAGSGRRRGVAGLLLLLALHVAALTGLHLLDGAGIPLHSRWIRAWAVAAPVLVLIGVGRRATPTR